MQLAARWTRPSILVALPAWSLPWRSAAAGNNDGGPAAAGTVARPGETQQVGDSQVTVHSYRRRDGRGLVRPAEGNVWLIVDMSMRNTGSNNYALSSAVQISLRVGAGRNFKQAAFVDTTTRFNGSVEVDQVLRGEIAFEVPHGGNGLTLIFRQRFQIGQAFWEIE